MTSLKTLAAAAALAALTATPVFAQAAIQEPGLFAFYHPNLDVLNGGAPPWSATPYGDASAASTSHFPRPAISSRHARHLHH